MKYKNQKSNLVIVSLLTVAYTVLTFLLMIGPMHMNSTGNINQLNGHTLYPVIYWVFSLSLIWTLYTALYKKTELLFYLLLILGIVIMIVEVFLFG